MWHYNIGGEILNIRPQVFIAPVVKLRFKLFTRPPAYANKKFIKIIFIVYVLIHNFWGAQTPFFIIGQQPKNPRISAFRK